MNPSFNRARAARVVATIMVVVGLAVTSAAQACSSNGDSTVAPPDNSSPVLDLTWLRANAKPLRTAEPDDDFSDLQPIKQMIGSARIVALGEDSHGTHEFFAMKHRLVRFLVEQMGFNTFAVEATWAESNRVNDFVQGGPGDPNVLLSNLRNWPLNTQEVADLLLWMRTHNANPGATPRVSFSGFDMQSSRVTMNDVDDYLSRVDTAARAVERAQYACYRTYQDLIGASSPDYLKAGGICRSGIQAVYDLIASNEARFVALLGRGAYDRALRAAQIVVQNERLRCCSNNIDERDADMAENADWLLDQAGPNAKIILWAHNGHINAVTGNMGGFLRARHGTDYVPLGFTMNSGLYNTGDFANPLVAPMLRPIPVSPAPPGSYEWQFAHVGQWGFLVDLRAAQSLSSNDPGAWIQGPLGYRIFDEQHTSDPARNAEYPRYLPKLFDLMIFFDTTSATKLLPFKYQ